jgi:glycosyltransferase involved in cell wall biosynthesis
LNSVLKQTFKNIEYIIVDGKSTDNSLKIIYKYKNDLKNNTKNLKIISEKDFGVYDGMNKGVELASGEWIIFLNSGDAFYDKDTIKNIFDNKKYKEDVLYGDVKIIINETNSKIVKAKSINSIYYGMPFCHQSSFTRATVLKKYKFDLNYKIASDYDFFLKIYKKGYKFKYINSIFSIYDGNGLSQNTKLLLGEQNKIFNNYVKDKKIKAIFKIKRLKQIFFSLLKKYLPKKIVAILRKVSI